MPISVVREPVVFMAKSSRISPRFTAACSISPKVEWIDVRYVSCGELTL